MTLNDKVWLPLELATGGSPKKIAQRITPNVTSEKVFETRFMTHNWAIHTSVATYIKEYIDGALRAPVWNGRNSYSQYLVIYNK